MIKPILVRLSGREIEVMPLAAAGAAIRCYVPAGPHRMATTVVVPSGFAVDQAAFWEAWRASGGDQQGLTWESGKPFVSPGSPGPVTPARLRSYLGVWLWRIRKLFSRFSKWWTSRARNTADGSTGRT